MIGDARRFTVRKGVGTSHVSPLNAFDKALMDAGIEDCNLIPVSSVLPPFIKETDEMPKNMGAFRPCVMARAQGYGTDLMAGIRLGFREDGKGGYVVEKVSAGEDISRSGFNAMLEDMLDSMGSLRGVNMVNARSEIVELKMNQEAFGCALVVLVYLP